MHGYIITWELRSDRLLVAVKECGRARHGGLWSVSLDDHLMLFGNQGYRFGRTRFNDTFERLGITNTTYLSTAGRRSEEVTLPDGTSSIFVDGSDGDTLIIKGLLNVKDRKRHRNR